MREYVAKLQERGELAILETEVDPKFELAAITQQFQKTSDLPLLFRQVKGTRIPVITNVYGSRRRLCDMIGAPDGKFCRRWLDLTRDPTSPSPATRRSPAPNERHVGRLSDLPLITYFEHDAAPYFNSAIYLARDPETRVPNLSFHRSMFVDDNELRSRLGETHDLALYYRKAATLGRPLEAAILLGASPEIFLAACASIPADADELQVAAAITGAPVPMQRCLSIDLDFPSDTEIVIEGRFHPGVVRPEGPYGEFMGYYVPRRDNPVFEVSSVHWREAPLFHSLNCGSREDMYPLDYLLASRIYRDLTARLPGIIDVACYPYLMNTVVQIRQQYEGHARHVLLAAFTAHLDYSKTCIVIDEDVDIHNLEDVFWAFLTRGRADTRAFVLKDVPGFYRDPHKDHWGRLAIDATKPFDRAAEFERKRNPVADGINLDRYDIRIGKGPFIAP